MSVESVLEVLKTMDFARNMEPEHLEQLAAMATEMEFSEDDVLFKEGTAADKIFLIKEGQIGIEIYVPSQGRVTILTISSGQLLGWSSLFQSNQYTATGRAILPTEAIAFDAVQLRDLCKKDHGLGCAIGWSVAEVISGRLKATRLQLLDIFAPAGN